MLERIQKIACRLGLHQHLKSNNLTEKCLHCPNIKVNEEALEKISEDDIENMYIDEIITYDQYMAIRKVYTFYHNFY